MDETRRSRLRFALTQRAQQKARGRFETVAVLCFAQSVTRVGVSLPTHSPGLRGKLARTRNVVPRNRGSLLGRMIRLMSDVTRLLSAIEHGETGASEQLLPFVYDELRKLAAARLAKEKPGQTLQATALVHEAYLRLVGAEVNQRWDSRGHFFAAAAEAMRRILVDQARRKQGPKAGGHLQRVELEQAEAAVGGANLDILALNEALEKLTAIDPRKAELVKLRYFAGLTIDQTAKALGVAPSTVDLDWAYAKSWLYAEMSGSAAAERDV